MAYHVKMGTKLTADYPMQRTTLKNGETGYKFEGAHKAMPLKKPIEGGVLVERSTSYDDSWSVVDSFESNHQHSEVENQYGVWKDRGFWFLKNGKIDKGEVTPFRALFEPRHKLGYAGGGVVQTTLYGSVENSELDHYKGQPTLTTDAFVSKKTYQFHHDAGPFADLYLREEALLDGRA